MATYLLTIIKRKAKVCINAIKGDKATLFLAANNMSEIITFCTDYAVKVHYTNVHEKFSFDAIKQDYLQSIDTEITEM